MANSLKELTKDVHHDAERKPFAKLLLSGNITPQQYYVYLFNQFHMYQALESKLDLSGIEDIARHNKIRDDIHELESLFDIKPKTLFKSTVDYIRYINSIHDQQRLLAHLYVRHFGDMYGGQIIKKRIPGSGSMYDFDNVEFLKQTVREKLTDDMAEEAKVCFNYAIRLFEEIMNE